MSKDKFQLSKESGIHYQFSMLAGNWEGMTKTWFEPGELADESPMRGSMKVILDGRFVMHEYEGILQGKPFNGLGLIGYNFSSEKFECAWVDSFHMGTGILFSEATAAGKLFSVLGSYGGKELAERWGWRTEIEMPGKDNIIISAYNISPDGEESKATETIYNRVL